MGIYGALLSIGCVFNIIPFVLINSIILNELMSYTSGFHCSTNGKCLIISSISIIIFGYIAKESVDCLWVSFVICLFCLKDIYIKSPLQYEDIPLEFRWYKCKPLTNLFIQLNMTNHMIKNGIEKV